MKILVANLGSTSFKYRLFDMADSRQLARGGAERIGSPRSDCFVEIEGKRQQLQATLPDHAVAVRQCLTQLVDPEQGCLRDASEVAAIGFKAVHGGRYSGTVRINEDVLAEMETLNDVAPAHNPPYIKAMRLLSRKLPDIPLVAAFETGFHRTIPAERRYYAIAKEWSDQLHIQKFGFHGASHRYIAGRTAELTGRHDLRIISCHLGGSSSLCAIRSGESVATTMGMSPQSGLPQSNRVGDFDVFALPLILKHTGNSLDQVLDDLANRSGLLGLSGVSGDIRDIRQAADDGNRDAALALDVYVAEIRRQLGSMMIALEGLDAVVFTGGIGENDARIRSGVCQRLDQFGIELDQEKNDANPRESRVDSGTGTVQLWVVPTNEEWIVASQTAEILRG